MKQTFRKVRYTLLENNDLLLMFIVFLLLLYSCEDRKSKEEAKISEPNITSVDIAIINGNILDGTSKEAYKANIYINNDTISYIGNLINPDLKIGKTIDADGKFVSPGFIDLHAHGNPLKTPDFENFLAMGVTTIVLGQDGSSKRVTDLKT